MKRISFRSPVEKKRKTGFSSEPFKGIRGLFHPSSIDNGLGCSKKSFFENSNTFLWCFIGSITLFILVIAYVFISARNSLDH